MKVSLKVFVKIFADKGYIGKQLFETLFIDDIHLVTSIRNVFATLLWGLDVYLMFTGDSRWVILVLIYTLDSVFLAKRSGGAKDSSVR